MNIKINFKLKFSQIIKIGYGVVAIIFIAASYFTGNFLYKNLYQVITQTEVVTVLRKETANEMVDVVSFEKIMAHLAEKQKEPSFDINKIRDIFSQ